MMNNTPIACGCSESSSVGTTKAASKR
jgi:hypothetical protein